MGGHWECGLISMHEDLSKMRTFNCRWGAMSLFKNYIRYFFGSLFVDFPWRFHLCKIRQNIFLIVHNKRSHVQG